jgi:hypothetical protein
MLTLALAHVLTSATTMYPEMKHTRTYETFMCVVRSYRIPKPPSLYWPVNNE